MCDRRRLAGAAGVVLGAAAAVAVSMLHVAAAPLGGRIHGRVIDRTAPPHAVAGQVVRLTIVERGASADQEATSGPSGAFGFAGLPVGGIRVFVLSTQYRGVRYVSDRIVLAPEAPARAADLIVYESTSSREVVQGTAALAIVDVARGAVRVSVAQGFLNPTDRTVAVSSEDPIVFPLPAGAHNVRALAGWRDPRVAPDRITDTFPLLPGSTRVAYAYELSTRDSHLRVRWLLPYGASDVEVLVPDAGVTFAGDGLKAAGSVAGPRTRYARWSGRREGRGVEIVLRLGGLPAARNPWPAAVAAGLGVVLFAGLALTFRRSRGAAA